MSRFRRNYLRPFPVAEATVLAVATATVAYFNRFMRIDMTEALEVLFRQCEGASDGDVLCQSRAQWSMATSLLAATILRYGLVILSYGCKLPAGIFIPSMAIGATFGRFVGILVKALQTAFPTWSFFSACPTEGQCITPGTYALLGAAGALAGVTRITVAVVVIMFELTGALTYILPIMLVVGIAKLVAEVRGKGGISDRLIKFNGYPMLDENEHAFGKTVGSIMTTEMDVLFARGMSVADVQQSLARGTHRGFPVVVSADDLTLLGYAIRSELRFALERYRHAGDIAASKPCVFWPGSSEDFVRTTAEMHGSRLADTGAPLRDPAGVDWSALGFSAPFSDAQHAADEFALPASPTLVHADDELDLGKWVDPTPLIVQPQLALEVVNDIFMKMGPRVVLVAEKGLLVGMVTVKDLLRHIAQQERGAKLSSSNTEEVNFEIGKGELEHALSWAWQKATKLLRPYMRTASHERVATADELPLQSTTLYDSQNTAYES